MIAAIPSAKRTDIAGTWKPEKLLSAFRIPPDSMKLPEGKSDSARFRRKLAGRKVETLARGRTAGTGATDTLTMDDDAANRLKTQRTPALPCLPTPGSRHLFEFPKDGSGAAFQSAKIP